MAWFDKQARVRRRIDVGREALAASVEEVAAQDELWDEDEEQFSRSGKTSIIPPRLRLQSRAMPAVQIERAKHAPVERKQALPENSPRSAAQAPGEGGPRLGRSTRVHLQAVRPESAQEPSTEHVRVMETGYSGKQGGPRQRAANSSGTDAPPARPEQSKTTSPAYSFPPLMGGRGMLKRGQKDATVANSHISERSVVTVMLTDNPGPVVVQYVSLYPRRGFTFHLSAPAAAQTSFNYVIWPF